LEIIIIMINMLYRGIMLAVVGCSTAAVLAQRFDCDPCVDRSGYTVKAIVHGPSEEAFWQYMKAVMVQAGKDMKVNFVMDLYDVFDSDIMAADIRAAAASSPPPDAVIVTIPTQEVQDAVAEVKDSMPIFAFNSAPNDGEFMRSLDGMVHMNEFIGGQIVGKYVNEVLDAKAAGEGPSSVTSKGLFVNHVPGNDSIESRFNGLVDAAGDSVEWEMYAPELIDAEGLTAVFADCTYSAIQLAGFVSMNATLTALENNGCLESDYVLGTYDVDTDIYDLIELGIVDVAVSQQQFIQASTVVVMASLFATTGEKLAVPYQGDAYLSGPFLVTQTNLPSQTLQVCAGDGFPVCPNTISPLGETSTCACTDRKEIKIVAITHATTTDIFWDPVYAGFTQAASDFGITLETRRFDPEFLDSDVIEEQILSIQDACNQDIDGLIVSFPSVDVIEAVANCTTKGIPVIGVNAGPDLAANSGYKYVG
jgi:ABC-type sugar transport system substrate-binding protein